MIKPLLPLISYCGINFGHNKWFRHAGDCKICNVKRKMHIEKYINELKLKWDKKCECGCGKLAAFDKRFSLGHFIVTEKFRKIRSEYCKNHPQFVFTSEGVKSIWIGRKRPKQCGLNNNSNRSDVKKKLSQHNAMKNPIYLAKHKLSVSSEKERKRKSKLLKNMWEDPKYRKNVIEKRINTYTKKLANGTYKIKNGWKTGYYKGTWYDSSLELKRMKYYDKNNIIWTKKHKIRIPYINNGINTFYVPDFLVIENGQKIIDETKGWLKDTDTLKAKVAIEFCKKNNYKYRFLLNEKLIEELSYIGDK